MNFVSSAVSSCQWTLISSRRVVSVGSNDTSGLGVVSSAELVVVQAFVAVVVVQLSSFVV